MEKLIIDVRLNEYTPRQPNPNVPFAPAEIARDAAACRAAGASIVHYHARDPETGAPSSDVALYAETARRIRGACDALVMPTLGANTVVDLDARIGHLEVMAKEDATRADFAPLDLASLSLPIWSPGQAAVGGDDLVYHNSVGVLKRLAARARAIGATPIAAIWNVGSLRLLEAFALTGVLPRRIFVELFLTEGALIAGHPGTVRGLEALLDFLPTSIECPWAVACYGASNLELARIAIERGGHVAIGLGDYAYPELRGPGLGGRAREGGWPTNADVVAEVAAMAKRAGRTLATPAEVRALLVGEVA